MLGNDNSSVLIFGSEVSNLHFVKFNLFSSLLDSLEVHQLSFVFDLLLSGLSKLFFTREGYRFSCLRFVFL